MQPDHRVVKTEHYGDIEVWLECQFSDGRLNSVYAAAGTDTFGRGQRGYGETAQAAVIDHLQACWLSRLTRTPVPPAPVVTATKELPYEFWAAIRDDKKIHAIKILRDVTGLTLRSSKEVVDKISERKAPELKFGFSATIAPVGTVIRIKGTLGDEACQGWVFEKTEPNHWEATGTDMTEHDSTVQEQTHAHGYDLLYIPVEGK